MTEQHDSLASFVKGALWGWLLGTIVAGLYVAHLKGWL